MDVLATRGGPIILGRTGENDYTTVVFPFDGPAGASVTVFNRLPGSISSYPVSAVEVQDNTVRWTVSSADLSVNGYGECEITYTLGDVVAKSVRYPTQVIASLDGHGDPPEGWDTWEAVFTALKAQAEAAAQTATDAAQTAESASEAVQNMTVSSTTLPPGSPLNVVKTIDPETGVVTLTFYLAPGKDGISPTVTVTNIPGGHRITITDVNGTHTVDVLNGKKGDTGATPDISIGDVSTLPLGSDATASMTGTPENPVLNIGIPVGLDDVATEATLAEIDAESKTVTGLLRQIVEDGGSSKDLNGYSLAPGAGGEVVLTYTDPDTQEAASVAMTTDTTGKAIADTLAEMANNWKGAIVNA